MMWCRNSGLWCLALLLLATAGCGKSVPVGDSGPNARPPAGLVPYKGTITVDGTPKAGVRVVLMDPEMMKKVVAANGYANGPSSMTDDNGAFAITTTKSGDGAVPGTYKVFFEWFPNGVGSYFDDPSVPIPPAIAAKLPAGVMAFYRKYKAGGPGNEVISIEAGKPQTDVKFELKTK